MNEKLDDWSNSKVIYHKNYVLIFFSGQKRSCLIQNRKKKKKLLCSQNFAVKEVRTFLKRFNFRMSIDKMQNIINHSCSFKRSLKPSYNIL